MTKLLRAFKDILSWISFLFLGLYVPTSMFIIYEQNEVHKNSMARLDNSSRLISALFDGVSSCASELDTCSEDANGIMVERDQATNELDKTKGALANAKSKVKELQSEKTQLELDLGKMTFAYNTLKEKALLVSQLMVASVQGTEKQRKGKVTVMFDAFLRNGEEVLCPADIKRHGKIAKYSPQCRDETKVELAKLWEDFEGCVESGQAVPYIAKLERPVANSYLLDREAEVYYVSCDPALPESGQSELAVNRRVGS